MVVRLEILIVFLSLARVHSEYAISDSRVHGGCLVSTNYFNRTCIYDKIVYLAKKVPFISRWSLPQTGPVELIKLPNYATSVIPITEMVPNSRSYSDNIISLISKSLEYFLNSYGLKVRIPPLSKNFPGIIEEDADNDTITTEDDESRRHKHKKDAKRFAMIFPLIATFKFILIKALLVPILFGIIAIKKMLVVAAMAVPAIFTMVRLCRWGGLGFGPLINAAAGLTSPYANAPFGMPQVDTIIGDFSQPHSQSAMSGQHPYYNRLSNGGEYSAKNLPSYNGQYNNNNYQEYR